MILRQVLLKNVETLYWYSILTSWQYYSNLYKHVQNIQQLCTKPLYTLSETSTVLGSKKAGLEFQARVSYCGSSPLSTTVNSLDRSVQNKETFQTIFNPDVKHPLNLFFMLWLSLLKSSYPLNNYTVELHTFHGPWNLALISRAFSV